MQGVALGAKAQQEAGTTDREDDLHRDAYGLQWKIRIPLFQQGSDSPPCPTRAGITGTSAAVKKGCLPRETEDMLIRAYRKPEVLTVLYRGLGFSGYKGGQAKDALIRAGMVCEVSLPTNRRGRKKKLLQITPRGMEYLKGLGITGGPRGRGGVKHIWYQQAVKQWYEQHGYVVETEATVGGTCLDVLVILANSERLGIEIATSPQYEEVNMKKALAAGLERFLLLCETPQLLETLQKRLKSLMEIWPGNKPGLKLVSDYMDNSNDD